MCIEIIFTIKVNKQSSWLAIISDITESMTVYGGKKYKPEVDIDRAEWSLFFSKRYLKCLKQSCYPCFINSQSLEFGDFFIIIITLAF